jgi:predicted lipid-binding transport protein (Tim44 family)
MENTMTKPFSLFALIVTLGLSMLAGDAEARRLGGGSSLGTQRQMTPPDRKPAPPAAAPAPSAPNAAAQPRRSWMGPVAGLAAGLGLAALAAHLGFGEELASLLLIGLIALVAVAVIAFVLRRSSAAPQAANALPQGAGAAPPAAAYTSGAPASARPDTWSAPRPATEPATQAGSLAAELGDPLADARPAAPARLPADFDAAGFARHARVNFIRLQAANDAGDLDDLRAFTTPEMFAELKMAIVERGDLQQHTDVLHIDAEVLEATEEGNRYVVSVRFTGLLREETDGPAVAVDEVWHLVKPREGKSGWLLAGIQQMQ